jgi:hypothetical protein
MSIFSFIAISTINGENEKAPNLFYCFMDVSLLYVAWPSANSMFHSCKEESNSGATAASFGFAEVKTYDKITLLVLYQDVVYKWYRVDIPHVACES